MDSVQKKQPIDDLIAKKIAAIKNEQNVYEIGHVTWVKEFIIEASGLENVAYFELVTIADKAEGYVDAIGRNSITIALTRISAPIQVGDEVYATGQEFSMFFSDDSIGHVIGIFGDDKLNGKMFENLEHLSIETPSIPIIDRTAVCRPLLTGVTGIDLLYPIGRGQRQLIIGDKKTGKTQLALDMITNQKDSGVLCIYVAIGKTKKEVKELYSALYQMGAMKYTVIVAAFNDECAPVLRSTPYAALSIAERCMMQEGRDVLVVIDDLKRHADVCREINLVAGNVPGRDAYPPDIFYTHSRLLEKGCQHKNGGSITIIPICETKGGEIAEYISTNIISITDGQIVLSEESFRKGQKPAINYGLSVSRLGGAVQEKRMKSRGAQVRRELLSYLETAKVFELANMDRMSPELQEKMNRGRKIQALLRQYKFNVKTVDEMLSLFAELYEVSL